MWLCRRSGLCAKFRMCGGLGIMLRVTDALAGLDFNRFRSVLSNGEEDMGWTRGVLRTIGVVTLCAAFVGCKGSELPISNVDCSVDDDCADGWVCVDALCVLDDDKDVETDVPDTDTGPGTPKADYTEKCTTDADCKTGLSCIQTESHGRMCTRPCPPDGTSDVCEDPNIELDMECLTMRPGGGDLVSICYPRAQSYCKSCERDGEDITGGCGTVGSDLCMVQDDGSFCAVDCSNGKSCPAGATCRAVLEGELEYMVCTPDEGRCLDCVDNDGDGYGQAGRNSECRFPDQDDCDDTDPRVHPNAQPVCDGVDTDCRGRADDTFRTEEGLYGGVDNCGTCGNYCYRDHVAVAECDLSDGVGACQIVVCDEGFADCDGDPSNGCEADLSSAQNCGGCGNLCGQAQTESSTCERLVEGEDRFQCEIICKPGFSNCDGNPTNGCEADLNAPASCGSCANDCEALYDNAEAACVQSECRLHACDEGFADCDGDPSNGCEADLSDESSCGACGVVCAGINTILPPVCTSGATPAQNSCTLYCAEGFADCNGIPNDGCEIDKNTDDANCGACNATCDRPNASAVCQQGSCLFQGCVGENADCNGDMGAAGLSSYHPNSPVNGCETYLRDNDTACGSCATDCTALAGTWLCEETTCIAQSCAGDALNCPGDAGQCQSNRNNPETCGNCSTNCLAAPNVTGASCSPDAATRCTITQCAASYADCNGLHSDGCEVQTSTNAQHCGGCGIACNLPNAVMACENGHCTFVECMPGWMNLQGTENTVGCNYQCSPQPGEDRPNDMTVSSYNWQHSDTNCDGIDGDISRALFVDWRTGNDNNPGTMALPLQTVNAALAEIQTLPGIDQIYVSEGTYNERIELIPGISIYGGFKASDRWTRVGSNKSILQNTVPDAATRHVIAVSGNQLGSGNKTVLQNLEIVAGSASSLIPGTMQGASSHALYCANCPGLELIGNIFTAGLGAPGSGALSPTGTPGEGQRGGDGTNGDHDGGSRGQGGIGGASSCGRTGGVGGQGGSRGKNAGVTGGTGLVGTPGGGGGSGGDPGRGGEPGTKGNDGTTGSAGAGGAATAAILSGYWQGRAGSVGNTGNHGNGGGGGGGGGGQGCTFCINGSGNGGGGGGGGGCGGYGGNGGGAGGGSFGLFFLDSTGVVIRNNTIRAGGGGSGGAGSVGGSGSAGGAGGSGSGHKTGEIGRGGNGGAGGKGGTGGGGGGGAGGPSVSIAAQGMTQQVLDGFRVGNTLQKNLGGQGGATPGGSAGSTGVAVEVLRID